MLRLQVLQIVTAIERLRHGRRLFAVFAAFFLFAVG